METIEERAQEYAHQSRRDAHDLKGERADAAFAAYCQGAEDEHKELTRRHDPKEELPLPGQPVIICTSPKIYHTTELRRIISRLRKMGYSICSTKQKAVTEDGRPTQFNEYYMPQVADSFQ